MEATILLVEDNDVLRGVLVETLQLLGYRVYAAASGAEALTLASQVDEENIGLVISDMVMPGMNAYELYEALQLATYEGKMLVITGYPMPHTGATLVEKPGVQWASKPIAMEALNLLVAQMLR